MSKLQIQRVTCFNEKVTKKNEAKEGSASCKYYNLKLIAIKCLNKVGIVEVNRYHNITIL